ncbi:MAG: hypothetical protein WKF51_02255 [Geodermatophilaceae bacterium]
MDLLGDVSGLRALVVGDVPRPAVAALAAAGAQVLRSLDASQQRPPTAGADPAGRDGWDLVLCTSGRLGDPFTAAATALSVDVAGWRWC